MNMFSDFRRFLTLIHATQNIIVRRFIIFPTDSFKGSFSFSYLDGYSQATGSFYFLNIVLFQPLVPHNVRSQHGYLSCIYWRTDLLCPQERTGKISCNIIHIIFGLRSSNYSIPRALLCYTCISISILPAFLFSLRLYRCFTRESCALLMPYSMF